MTGPSTPESLYELPPEDFIAARNEAAARARAAGDRALAARLAALRRPTVGAWLVNLVARRRPGQIGELLELGTALREAQQQLAGDRMRELSGRRRAAIAGLVAQARRLAVEAGRRPQSLPLAEVEATLAAALADDDLAEAVREGRLARTAEYAGFGEPRRPDLRVIDGGAAAPERERRPAREPARGRGRGAGEPGGVTEPGGAAGARGAGEPTEVVEPGAAEPGAGEPGAAGPGGVAGQRAKESGRAERARAVAARTARIEEAEAALRRATADERDAARALAELSAELDRVRERHAAAQVALREARLRRRAAERQAHRAGR